MDDNTSKIELTDKKVAEICQGLFIINKNVKSCSGDMRKYLYLIKNRVLQFMIDQKYGCVRGIQKKHNSSNGEVLIEIETSHHTYGFHRIPTRDEYTSLPYLGERTKDCRNPRIFMKKFTAESVLLELIQQIDSDFATELQKMKPKKFDDNWLNQSKVKNSSYFGCLPTRERGKVNGFSKKSFVS